MRFLDEVEIRVISGHGGRGCISFRREKYVPFGGPDGGAGGRGGDVVFSTDASLNTLVSLRGRRVFQAEHGEHGSPRRCTGRSGEHLVIPVPVGTILYDADTNELIADLDAETSACVVARGGQGGRGNTLFKTPTHRTPRRADAGGPSEERRLRLELKLLADVGVVGFPNAGKSTFVSRVSSARPRIADYPFTTLVPHLGVVERGLDESWVVADVPGLIEGSAGGAGLGHRFLKHIQRTRLLLHLVSATPEETGPALRRYRVLRQELERFDAELARRPEVLALSRVDAVSPEALASLLEEFAAEGLKPFCLSAVTGQGLEGLLDALSKALRELGPPA
jgi:GTP-binding protein